MGKDALSFEELAVLMGDPARPAGRSSEADDLRCRLAGADGSPKDDPGCAAADATRSESAQRLDDWPWPPRLAHRLAAAWSELLRTTVSVSVMHVEPVTFGEFLLRCRYPTCLATATCHSGVPVLAVEIPLAVACPAIPRMLGGPLEDQTEPEQGLTQIEQRLAKRLAFCLVPEALAIAGDPEPLEAVSLMIHDRLPRVAPTWARTQAVYLEFQVKYGPVVGPLRCCVPWAT
jgi:flagellar motor switch protein FliM